MSSTDTRATVLNGPVRNGELAKVVADHLGLDLDGVEDLLYQILCQVNPHAHQSKPPYNSIKPINQHQRSSKTPRPQRKEEEGQRTHLSIVDTNHRANHLWDDDHVTKVSLDDSGLLIWGSLSLSLAELLDETHRLALETALEAPAGTGVDDLYRS